jgi:glucose-6-phosphate 1-epimerase
MNVDELNDKFGIEGEIGFAELEGDLVFAMIANKYADANISLYGAHITGFRPIGNMDVLWMSPLSKFREGSAIRGGIPVCFPWFGPHESNENLPQHGFARLLNWEVIETKSTQNGESLLSLQLCSSDKTKRYWPYDFCAEMIFTIGLSLTVTLKITNTSSVYFEYTSALHSYFSLSSIENIAIEGLKNTRYQSQLDGGDYLQESPLLRISEAETRHYYNTETPAIIYDPVFNRRIRIDKTGSRNTTIWNPWVETCEEMEDMPDDGYLTFVCLETVNKIGDIINLAPGEFHQTTAEISIEI